MQVLPRRREPPTDQPLPRLRPKPLASRLSGTGLPYRLVNRIERFYAARRLRLSSSSPELRRIRGRLRLVRSRVVDHPNQVVRDNRAIVEAICTRLDVPCMRVPAPGQRLRLAVPEGAWADVLDELAGSSPDVYLGVTGQQRARLRKRRRALITDHPARLLDVARHQRVVRVGTWVVDDRIKAVYGPEWACELERWDTDGDTVVAPRPNSYTQRVVPPSTRSGVPSGLPGAPDVPFFEPDFDIDVVVMWVDGSDPEWQQRKREALRRSGADLHEIANVASRFRDNGELRFALRSLHRNASWLRRIHLVTDDQVPTWLRPSDSRINIVSHRQLFDGVGVRHSFNSHAIGARLHRIPDLSEHFIVTNDDVFLGRPLSPSTFFLANGLARIFPSRSTLPADGAGSGLPHEEARRNAATLLEESFGRRPTQNLQHIPLSFRKSLLFELEQRYSAAFQATWRNQFRSAADVELGWLHHYYAFLKGMAAPASMRYDYYLLSSPAAWQRLGRLLRRRNLDAFCLNDDEEDITTFAWQHRVYPWLAAYFPEIAPWER